MKRQVCVLLAGVCALFLCACSGRGGAEELTKWDCSVTCAEDSGETYVITYSDEEVSPSGTALSFQNRNGFDIAVHLLTSGKEERTAEIPAGGGATLYQLEKGAVYTVGCHADVTEGTEIKLVVYDGVGTEAYG